ncbi:Proteasome subunit alpha type-4 [Thelohanellus kitauei]|uniref:Proteasome subunit alpha type-4 n=1 Tax=Thelohanellus kitauei TaxID=669202 RepID=A0A0C2MX47_THEKT|nr:Proteasome subunit alpha type-4 [Thelohanellus kitauei]
MTLVSQMRVYSERHVLRFQEPITCEELVKDVCYLKQQYTQIGGYRPFGVSLLYAAWDLRSGFQLYQSDPSGNFSCWKATCIGKNSEEALTMLKSDFRDEMSIEEAMKLMSAVLKKSIEKTPLTSDGLEIALIQMVNGKIIQRLLNPEEIDQLLLLV